MPLDDLLDVNTLSKYGHNVELYLKHEIFAFDVIAQLFFLMICALVAYYVYEDAICKSRAFFKSLPFKFSPPIKRLLAVYHDMMGQILMMIPVIIYLGVAHFMHFPFDWVVLGFKIVGSYIVIRFITVGFVKDSNWAKLIGVFLYILTLSFILNFFGGTLKFSGLQKIELMGYEVSLLSIINGVVLLAVLLWSSLALSSFTERKIKSINTLTPSVKVLFAKLSKFFLIAAAFLIGLTHIGIDLSAFAIFGGAIGVGIGLGLQKVFSNLVSGIILLLDKSIKPGDIITVGDTYGRVDALGARYTSVATTDGKEYLIPNEDMITNQVINWSFSSDLVASRIALKFADEVDLRQAMEVCEKAVQKVSRVLNDPPPKCVVVSLGDYWVNVDLQFWISDPINGFTSLKSEIYLAVLDALKAQNITVPFLDYDSGIASVKIPRRPKV